MGGWHLLHDNHHDQQSDSKQCKQTNHIVGLFLFHDRVPSFSLGGKRDLEFRVSSVVSLQRNGCVVSLAGFFGVKVFHEQRTFFQQRSHQTGRDLFALADKEFAVFPDSKAAGAFFT